MKKYITGVLAVIIAVAAFAFTKPENKKVNLTDVTFYYTPTSYGINDVQNKDNWTSTGSPMDCEGTAKACRLIVNQSATTETGGVRHLTNNITATVGVSPNYVPSSSTTGFVSKLDKN